MTIPTHASPTISIAVRILKSSVHSDSCNLLKFFLSCFRSEICLPEEPISSFAAVGIDDMFIMMSVWAKEREERPEAEGGELMALTYRLVLYLIDEPIANILIRQPSMLRFA